MCEHVSVVGGDFDDFGRGIVARVIADLSSMPLWPQLALVDDARRFVRHILSMELLSSCAVLRINLCLRADVFWGLVCAEEPMRGLVRGRPMLYEYFMQTMYETLGIELAHRSADDPVLVEAVDAASTTWAFDVRHRPSLLAPGVGDDVGAYFLNGIDPLPMYDFGVGTGSDDAEYVAAFEEHMRHAAVVAGQVPYVYADAGAVAQPDGGATRADLIEIDGVAYDFGGDDVLRRVDLSGGGDTSVDSVIAFGGGNDDEDDDDAYSDIVFEVEGLVAELLSDLDTSFEDD